VLANAAARVLGLSRRQLPDRQAEGFRPLGDPLRCVREHRRVLHPLGAAPLREGTELGLDCHRVGAARRPGLVLALDVLADHVGLLVDADMRRGRALGSLKKAPSDSIVLAPSAV
jgi:hypothetical protein